MSTITLTVIQGSLSGKQYSFDQRSTCILGRALDCNILLPDDQAHSTISRYHCLIDINPPELCIRDFGSLNGTYVNGKNIGQREVNTTIDKAKQMIYPEYELQHNDQFKLGESVFLVSIDDTSSTSNVAVNISAQNSSPDSSHEQADPLDKINLLLGQAEKSTQEDKQLIAIKGYHISKELGKGSMGAVYLAKKQDSNELHEIALKVMLPKVESDPKARQQFIRETKNTKLLDHDNIVRVYDIGCYDDTFFFTTDYCEMGSLSQLINRSGGKLPLFEAIKLLLQILDGLEYAHTVDIPLVILADGKKTSAQGLVHRDLKPGNILLTKKDGEICAKIADFGLAKAFDVAGLSGRTATGVSAGTPYYMPRQQVINFKFSKPEVDVWAAAATFYRMVTGKHPRKYTKGSDPWLTTLKSAVVPIRDHETSIPHRLAQVIDQALVDKPDIHYKSAVEFKDDLLKVI